MLHALQGAGNREGAKKAWEKRRQMGWKPKPRQPAAAPVSAAPGGGADWATETADEKQLRTAMKSASVIDVKEFDGGISKTFKAKAGDTAVVVKPQWGLHSDVRSGMPGARDIPHEVAAWTVNKALGRLVDMPLVLKRDVRAQAPDGEKLGPSSVAAFKAGDPLGHDYSAYNKQDVANIGLFDAIIGNADRHGGNALARGQHLIAIDHGLSFPNVPTVVSGNHDCEQTRNKKLSDGEKKLLRTFQSRKDDVSKALREDGLNRAEINGMWGRVDTMIKTGYLVGREPRDIRHAASAVRRKPEKPKTKSTWPPYTPPREAMLATYELRCPDCSEPIPSGMLRCPKCHYEVGAGSYAAETEAIELSMLCGEAARTHVFRAAEYVRNGQPRCRVCGGPQQWDSICLQAAGGYQWDILASGTPAGAKKAWDTRGRKGDEKVGNGEDYENADLSKTDELINRLNKPTWTKTQPLALPAPAPTKEMQELDEFITKLQQRHDQEQAELRQRQQQQQEEAPEEPLARGPSGRITDEQLDEMMKEFGDAGDVEQLTPEQVKEIVKQVETKMNVPAGSLLQKLEAKEPLERPVAKRFNQPDYTNLKGRNLMGPPNKCSWCGKEAVVEIQRYTPQGMKADFSCANESCYAARAAAREKAAPSEAVTSALQTLGLVVDPGNPDHAAHYESDAPGQAWTYRGRARKTKALREGVSGALVKNGFIPSADPPPKPGSRQQATRFLGHYSTATVRADFDQGHVSVSFDMAQPRKLSRKERKRLRREARRQRRGLTAGADVKKKLALTARGTPEGAKKAWETRGRRTGDEKVVEQASLPTRERKHSPLTVEHAHEELLQHGWEQSGPPEVCDPGACKATNTNQLAVFTKNDHTQAQCVVTVLPAGKSDQPLWTLERPGSPQESGDDADSLHHAIFGIFTAAEKAYIKQQSEQARARLSGLEKRGSPATGFPHSTTGFPHLDPSEWVDDDYCAASDLWAALDAAWAVLYADGTPEGARKAWDTRGRGRKEDAPSSRDVQEEQSLFLPGIKPPASIPAESRAQVSLRKRISQHSVTDVEELGGGINPTYTGMVGDFKIAIKPESGIVGAHRTAIEAGRDTDREMAAVTVNEALGHLIDMPAIVKVDLGSVSDPEGNPLGESAVSEFREGDHAGDDWSSYAPVEIAKMGLFDAIIGNSDRHGGNALADSTGHLIAIDHGLSFPARKYLADGNEVAMHERDPELSPPEITLLRKFLSKQPQVSAALRKNGLHESEIDGMWARVQDMVASGQLFMLHRADETSDPPSIGRRESSTSPSYRSPPTSEGTPPSRWISPSY